MLYDPCKAGNPSQPGQDYHRSTVGWRRMYCALTTMAESTEDMRCRRAARRTCSLAASSACEEERDFSIHLILVLLLACCCWWRSLCFGTCSEFIVTHTIVRPSNERIVASAASGAAPALRGRTPSVSIIEEARRSTHISRHSRPVFALSSRPTTFYRSSVCLSS